MTRAETLALRLERKRIAEALQKAIISAVQEYGGKIPDFEIAAMVGAGENTIWRARAALKIPAFKMYGDTEGKRAMVHEHYVVLGKPAEEVALLMGITGRQVRKIAAGAGYKRDPAIWHRNAKAGIVKASATRRKNHEAKKAERDLLNPPFVQLSDAEMVAKAMEAGKVTVLPAGHACGITRWEAALHAAYPARALSTEEQRKRAGRIMAAKARTIHHAEEAAA